MRAALLAGILVCVVGGVAFGQASTADLRREVDRLSAELEKSARETQTARDEVVAVARERDALAARIKQAEAELIKLRRQVGVLREEYRTRAPGPIPTDPLASPFSLVSELQRRYDHELASLPSDTPEQQSAYAGAARAWCERMSGELRGRAEWLLEIDQIEQLRDGSYEARISVVDEATMLPIGDPIRREIPNRIAKQIMRRPEVEVWRTDLLVIARPKFNPNRQRPGVFNMPLFIGPMVEFGIELDWRRVLAVEPPPIGDPEAAPDDAEPVDR